MTRLLARREEMLAAGARPLGWKLAFGTAAVMETLVSVRGIGPWTAQMVLMFRLGRPDVFPELDLGVQKAVQKLRRMRKLPTPKQMMKIGATYAPYRTYAAWYLWRSLELPEE